MSKEIPINIYCFGISQKLFQQIFTKEAKSNEEKDFGIIEQRMEILKTKFVQSDESKWKKLLIPLFIHFFIFKKNYWIGYKYPELEDNNKNKILFDLYKKINTAENNEIKASENKNTIIIKFGNSYIKEFSSLINKIQKDKPFILFLLKKNEIYPEIFKTFQDPQYVSYMIYDENEQNLSEIHKKIYSYIFKKQNYFYETGYIHDLFHPSNFMEYNILLTGESRAGKSSFINRIFKKLVSHEGQNLESLTTQIKEYKFDYTREKTRVGGLNLIDTPGMINKDYFKQIKNKLDEYFSRIHIIYFFLKAQSNMEYCIDMLKYINDKNKSLIKKGRKKIPIIFIRNGEDLVNNNSKPIFFQYLKDELKKYNLFELYDNSLDIKKEIKEINEDNFLEDDLANNNYNNYIDNNIIQIHIPTGKNINNIFMITHEYLKNNNLYLLDKDDDEFIQIKKDTKQLIQYFIQEKIKNNKLNSFENKDKKSLQKKCNDFVNKIKNECSLLYNHKLFNIKKASNLESPLILILFPFIFASFFLPSFISYGLAVILDFLKETTIDIANEFGFEKKDLEYYNLEKYLKSFNNENIKTINDSKNDKKIKLMKDNEKNSKIIENDTPKDEETNQPISETKISEIIKSNKQLFEDLLLYIGPIQCLIKGKEVSLIIFKIFDVFRNRKEKDWNLFNVEKIN